MLVPCPHRTASGVCAIASELSGRDVVPWRNVCETCVACAAPQQRNYVTASIAVAVWTYAGDRDRAQEVRADCARQGLFRVGRVAGIVVDTTPAPHDGPGTELKRLFDSLDINERLDCDCEWMMREMNALGAAGCRRERPRLVKALKANAKKYSWVDTIRAAKKVAASELALQIDLRDPIGWLFDEAVRRWEAREAKA